MRQVEVEPDVGVLRCIMSAAEFERRQTLWVGNTQYKIIGGRDTPAGEVRVLCREIEDAPR